MPGSTPALSVGMAGHSSCIYSGFVKEDGGVLSARATLPEHVVYRAFDVETVLLDLGTGRYHGLNPTGGRVLELMVSGANAGDAMEQLAEEYGQDERTVREDMVAFCCALADRGLIELRSPGGR